MPSRIYDVYITIPPDGGYSWVIAAISFFGYTIADGIGSSFYLYRRRISQDLGISSPMSAAIGSTYSSLCLFTGPIVSSLCNLYGFRWILIAGGILTSSGMGLAYFSKNFPTMLLLFGIITGIGGGCALIPITAPVGYWFDKKRPIALGASSAGSGIGMLLVPYTTCKIMEMYGWKTAFFYHSALFSLYIVLGIFLISLPPVLLKPDDTTQSQPSPRQVGEVHHKKIKAHNKYHKAASEIIPSSVLQISGTDRMFNASLSRNFRATGSTTERYRILSRPTLRQSSATSSFYLVNRICICCKKQELGHRPMYKTDIFYQGSVFRLKEVKTMQTEKAIDYAMSVSKLPTKRDILEEGKVCVCCPEALRRTFNTMIDLSIMKEYCFVLFLLSNSFFTMGSCLPVLYIQSKAQYKNHFPRNAVEWLVPSIGIGTFFGRLLAGILLQMIPELHAFHICLSVNLAVVLLTFGILYFDNIYYYFLYTSLFGMFFGIFTSIRSLILVDYLGLERLTTATGVSFAFGGLALLVGPPIADFLSQLCNCVKPVFYFAGGLMSVSIVFLGLLPVVKKRARKDVENI